MLGRKHTDLVLHVKPRVCSFCCVMLMITLKKWKHWSIDSALAFLGTSSSSLRSFSQHFIVCGRWSDCNLAARWNFWMRKIKRIGTRWEDRAESRKQGEEECRYGWNKGEKMEDGRRWAEAAKHRGRRARKELYRCGETLLIIFSVTFVSISHCLLSSSLFPPPCLIIT